MIDRKALVRRHNVTFDDIDPRAPLTLGNGDFAFTADVTGLQTVPDAYPAPGRYVEQPGTLLGTQSSWGWHSTPVETEPALRTSLKEYASPHGPVRYVDLAGKTSATALDGGTAQETWLRNNPHRLMLGAVALAPESVGSGEIRAGDIRPVRQELDLWTGELSSSFRIGAAAFDVRTVVHPDRDTLAVSIRSTGSHPPAVRIAFPHGSEDWGNAADWTHPERHSSELQSGTGGWEIRRTLDATKYCVHVCAPGATLVRRGAHDFLLSGQAGEATFTIDFSPSCESRGRHGSRDAPSFDDTSLAAARHWERHWSQGGMVDFSGSTDPRAVELERRVILSQYLTAVNGSGAVPPQETGLMVNSWRGRFHLEMHWWHAAHFPVWGRPKLLERSLNWYFYILTRSRETAREQGFPGARWPKQVGPDGRESPSDIGPFLIWQQPHPIYLAELMWRCTGSLEDAGRLAPLVFETAAFMAAYAARTPDGATLGPPLVPAQESYGFMRGDVENPTFELAYWRWALETAQKWRRRLGLPEVPEWSETARGMVSPHVAGGVYSAISVPPFTIRTDHPSMLAALGFVPATGFIDPGTMSRTLDSVLADWDWDSTWGWDYPMIAMTATRLGRPDDALDALLMDRGKNTYLANGHNFQTDALPVYLPGNGGLLAAVALMAAGYDGSAASPGFPADGGWQVAVEGIHPMP
ncbi:glycoside hydrolase family 92 protein [Arthrobacter livingstonensis]|uniref:glycoside hydrolase family 92 protein n=1 Tax=Arthrobacter livingstonensis TaxID=670078 RepID=UPI001FE64401|nr:glycoside hydrolase family 92 protein [Arthrobacter livingstonensis]